MCNCVTEDLLQSNLELLTALIRVALKDVEDIKVWTRGGETKGGRSAGTSLWGEELHLGINEAQCSSRLTPRATGRCLTVTRDRKDQQSVYALHKMGKSGFLISISSAAD